MVRVAIYSDEPILAIGLERLIADDPELEVTASCSSLFELKEHLTSENPELAVVDLTPQITSTSLRELRDMASDCKLILWATSISADFAFRALTIGIRGILSKTLPLDAHCQCLHRVYSGQLWFEKRLTDNFRAPRCVALSPREGQLVTLLSHGMANKQIAIELGITEGTVKVYLSHLFQKCGTNNRFDMAVYGRQNLSMGGILGEAGGLRSLVMEPMCR